MFILSLDGGGVRSVFTARILERLWDDLPELDLLAGTSAGAIIACLLGLGQHPSQATTKMVALSEDVFSRKRRFISRLFRAKYKPGPLEQHLASSFSGSRLRDLRTPVVIPTIDASNPTGWKVKVYESRTNAGDQSEHLTAVLRAATAAPTYFPLALGHADGGLFANNPSVVALATALDRRARSTPHRDDVFILSIGSGTQKRYVSDLKADWGYTQWGKRIVPLLMDSQVGTADFICSTLLGNRYHRIQVPLEKDWSLDDTESIPAMLNLADQLPLGRTLKWLGVGS